jgi:hypothetical protein
MWRELSKFCGSVSHLNIWQERQMPGALDFAGKLPLATRAVACLTTRSNFARLSDKPL